MGMPVAVFRPLELYINDLPVRCPDEAIMEYPNTLTLEYDDHYLGEFAPWQKVELNLTTRHGGFTWRAEFLRRRDETDVIAYDFNVYSRLK